MNKTKQTWVLLIVLTLVYLLLNIVFIVWPFIPGLGTLVFWAGLGPLIASLGVWWLTKPAFDNRRSWVAVSVTMTVLFSLAGYVSFFIISQLWASV